VLPDPGVLIAVGIGAGLGGALVLLVAGLHGGQPPGGQPGRGRADDAGRRPSRWQVWWHRARSPRPRGRVAGALGAGVVVLVLTRWPVAAGGVVALIVAWPYLFGGSHAEQAAIGRLEALVVWTESLRDTVAANASLEQAISASTHRAPPLLQPALARLAGQIRVQTPLDAALLDLAADLDDPSADLVIAALVLNVRRRGDRLAQVLSGLAGAAREELDLRRRVNAGRAGLRRAVQIIVVITLAIAAYLTLLGGTYLHPYDSPAGQAALACVLGLFAAGFAWMRRLATDQNNPPFLTRPGRPPDPRDLRLAAALTGLPAPERGSR
jgi:tight adherence protein B